ncbi:IclR family transcriptional regulator [Tenacibaculum xiamenense]|uniref:IclR family transcriptional regulator n=1 Tax=Tenacibaculum xiamenense TaxID=1261553 RepID=UPI0038B5D766
MPDSNDKKINQSIIKAFKLLDAFTEEKKTWGVRELAQKTAYNKSTVYRLLHTLSSLNIVHQNSNDKYSLGSKLFELGNRVSIYKAITNLTRTPIKQVALDIQETVLLSILKERQVFHIDKADSLHGLKINTSIGSYQPIHATASGKLLFSFLSSIEKEDIINSTKFQSYTQNTITSKSKLLSELDKIKDQEYALDMEELESGLVCIAIPIRNKKGNVIASLSASGPLSRFKMENVSNYISILKKGIKDIERAFSDFESLP